MDESNPAAMRARMHELQAMPDSQRSDAEWDELNELEIIFAPGNRVGAGQGHDGNRRKKPGGGQRNARGGQRGGRSGPPPAGNDDGGGAPPAEGGGDGADGGKRTVRRFRKRAPKPARPAE